MIQHGNQATARLQDSKHLVRHRPRIRDMVQHTHRADDVEVIVRKWQTIAVDLPEVTRKSAKRKPLPTELHRSACQINPCNLRAVSRVLKQDIAVAAADIENLQPS